MRSVRNSLGALAVIVLWSAGTSFGEPLPLQAERQALAAEQLALEKLCDQEWAAHETAQGPERQPWEQLRLRADLLRERVDALAGKLNVPVTAEPLSAPPDDEDEAGVDVGGAGGVRVRPGAVDVGGAGGVRVRPGAVDVGGPNGIRVRPGFVQVGSIRIGTPVADEPVATLPDDPEGVRVWVEDLRYWTRALLAWVDDVLEAGHATRPRPGYWFRCHLGETKVPSQESWMGLPEGTDGSTKDRVKAQRDAAKARARAAKVQAKEARARARALREAARDHEEAAEAAREAAEAQAEAQREAADALREAAEAQREAADAAREAAEAAREALGGR